MEVQECAFLCIFTNPRDREDGNILGVNLATVILVTSSYCSLCYKVKLDTKVLENNFRQEDSVLAKRWLLIILVKLLVLFEIILNNSFTTLSKCNFIKAILYSFLFEFNGIYFYDCLKYCNFFYIFLGVKRLIFVKKVFLTLER